MMNIKYNLSIPARDQAEADQKAEALSQLSGQLDGKTLKALADKIPGILKDPLFSGKVKSFLGI